MVSARRGSLGSLPCLEGSARPAPLACGSIAHVCPCLHVSSVHISLFCKDTHRWSRAYPGDLIFA